MLSAVPNLEDIASQLQGHSAGVADPEIRILDQGKNFEGASGSSTQSASHSLWHISLTNNIATEGVVTRSAAKRKVSNHVETAATTTLKGQGGNHEQVSK